MSTLLARLAAPGSNTGFHASALATVATGGTVLLTAGDLGPLSPMLLAIGLYLIFFGVVVEAAFALRAVAGRLARRHLQAASIKAQQS